MSYDEFWTCEPERYVVYRKAYELNRKRRNEDLWLQGLYNFKAISTAISNVHLDGKHHELNKYFEKPIELFEKTKTKEKSDVEVAKQTVIDKFTRLKEQWDMRKNANG